MLLLFYLFYSLYIELSIYVPENYLQMICYLPKWWAFLTYYGFKSRVNVTDALEIFAENRIILVSRRASTFNQAYDKLKANQDKYIKIQLLDLAHRKVHGQINQ